MFFSWFRDAFFYVDPFSYKAVVILLLFRFGHLYYSRKHFRSSRERTARLSSDATWFLPVYVWGIESLVHLARPIISMRYKYLIEPMHFSDYFFLTVSILMVVIGLCWLQEKIARGIGMTVRKSQATIPLSVLASILGVLLTWVFVHECLVYGSIIF
jgi:hypothetical protein